MAEASKSEKVTNVGTSWTDIVSFSPNEGIRKIQALFEHVGSSNKADFRLQAQWNKDGETSSFFTRVTEKGLENGDEPVVVEGTDEVPDTWKIQAKAQSSTVDVLGALATVE